MEHSVLNPLQIDVLSTVYLVWLSFSVIGSASVLLVSLVRWRQLRDQVHLLVQLALADLLAALILMFTSATNKFTLSQNVEICKYMLPLSLTFYFISFLLVVVYAWKSRNMMLGWRTRPAEVEGSQTNSQSGCTNIVMPVFAFVWLGPILIYLAYVLVPLNSWPSYPEQPSVELREGCNDTKHCTGCILFLHVPKHSCLADEENHDTFIRIILFLVVIPVIVFCSVIYHEVGKWYKAYEQREHSLFPPESDARSRKRIARTISTTRNMVRIILLCWTPTLLLILLSVLTNLEKKWLFVIYLFQATGVSLQGLFNSIVYAWSRRNFTEAVLGENTPLVTHEQRTAFFEESLGSSI